MNGILNFLKPPGMTSHDVVAVCRRLTGIKRIGHTGTLDPGASGVLPVCIGQATRVAEYVLEMPKSYRAELTLGTSTDTEDAAGTVVDKKPAPRLQTGEVHTALQSFVGPQLQIPPMYSAVRIQGEKLYERARRGETIERKARPVQIYDITLLWARESRIMFDVTCSRGTYIRTLCKDIALKLGTVGHMSYLLRTCVGPFTLEDALTLEEVAALQEHGQLASKLDAADTALTYLPEAHLSGDAAALIHNGVGVRTDLSLMAGTLVRIYGPDGDFFAIAQMKDGYLRPKKVFK